MLLSRSIRVPFKVNLAGLNALLHTVSRFRTGGITNHAVQFVITCDAYRHGIIHATVIGTDDQLVAAIGDFQYAGCDTATGIVNGISRIPPSLFIGQMD